MLTYDEVTKVIPPEELANKCGSVEALHERTSWNHEYGISWDDFMNQYYEEWTPLLKEWFNTVPQEEVRGWLESLQYDLVRKLEQVACLLAKEKDQC